MIFKNGKTLVLLAALAASGPAEAGEYRSSFSRFVTRSADKLMDGGKELRFISFNIPNLHYNEDNLPFRETNPWRLPDAYEITDALLSAKQAGGTVVRCFALSVRHPGESAARPVHVTAPGRFGEEAFRTLDLVLALANSIGIRLIIPLVDNWKWWGGIADYAAFRGKRKEAFWTDPQVISDFKKTIRYVVNRRNTVTGVLYKDDKAVLAWETGNELQCPQSWTHEIGLEIKRLDPNHLVLDGRHGTRLTPEMVEDTATDFVTTHHYPAGGPDILDLIPFNRNLARGKKPYFVGEFGFMETPKVEAVLDRVTATGTAGALIWSLRYHNRDGGFYWHSEPFGFGKYKAYHWPGFESGAAYDEKALLALLRRKAFRIRGLSVPPLPAPEAPQLLPIDSVSAISWRGSVGASAYHVERAESSNGPWLIVGNNVSDAAVAYRPLFNDTKAETGKRYFYRVRAKNESGVSPPSNVVGPVSVFSLALVDELRDGSLLYARSGSLSFVSKNTRSAKEDLQRVAGTPESFLVYRTPGEISGAVVYAFFPKQVVDFDIRVSGDGVSFQPASCRKAGYFLEDATYGYFKPVAYELSAPPEGSRFLKITFKTDAQIGRVEITHRGQ